MSHYCAEYRYNEGASQGQFPRDRHGESACPFNTFYWDFLDRHQDKLRSQGRMNLILKNLERMDAEERAAIRVQAKQWQTKLTASTAQD